MKLKVLGIPVWIFDSSARKTNKRVDKALKKEEKKSPKQLLKEFKTGASVLKEVLKRVRLLPRIKRLQFSMKFGLFDAAQTGTAAGGVFALVYGIKGRLFRSKRVSVEGVSVTPDFQVPCFSIHCSGIITTCLAHIMGIAVVVLAVIKKQLKEEE